MRAGIKKPLVSSLGVLQHSVHLLVGAAALVPRTARWLCTGR